MLPRDHELVEDLAEQHEDAPVAKWLEANIKHYTWFWNKRLKGDTRNFLQIRFDSEDDALLFQLKFQKAGDITTANGECHRVNRRGGIWRIAQSQIVDADREKLAMTFEGVPRWMSWKNANPKRKATSHYSISRNLAGYFLSWEIKEDGMIADITASKTKKIVVERARKKAGWK